MEALSPSEFPSEILRTLLSQPRYHQLSKYFQGLEDADLGALSQDELVDAAKPQHKLLMRIFARAMDKFVHPPDPPSALVVRTVTVQLIDKDTVYLGTLIPLRQRVQSVLLRNFDSRLLPIAMAASQITATLSALDPRPPVLCISLGENSLIDADLADLWAGIQAPLSEASYPPLTVILQLPRNRLIYPDEIIKDIIQCAAVRFLDVALSPFTSFERRDFFHHLSEDAARRVYSKLIFIPHAWLENPGPGWRNLLADTTYEELIVTTHREYYRLVRYFGDV